MKRYALLVMATVLVSTSASAVNIKISVKGEQLAFEPTQFEVKAGEKVTLKFVNVSKSMPHNWVLGKPGTEAKIGADSQNVGEKGGYTSTGPEVLQKTPMVQPGKTAEITFTAPKEKGAYPYLCTFPGHWVIMKGSMNVK